MKELINLISDKHKNDKVLIFTQYADTARYLYEQLQAHNIQDVACATGGSENPTLLASRFSPVSNEYQFGNDKETRVLIATDVLSEGQNLQDSHIIINFDLPWAIIKLIQRAGRVDRIGQKSEEILCYNFLPAEGVEKILLLRGRLKIRLKQNAEVVGTDERFFDDEDSIKLKDLYNENSQVLDEEDSNDIDLSSYAYQIWQNAIEENAELKDIIPNLPDIVYSTKKAIDKKGVIVYTQTAYGNDILTFVDNNGNVLLSDFHNTEVCNINDKELQDIGVKCNSVFSNRSCNEFVIGGENGIYLYDFETKRPVQVGEGGDAFWILPEEISYNASPAILSERSVIFFAILGVDSLDGLLIGSGYFETSQIIYTVEDTKKGKTAYLGTYDLPFDAHSENGTFRDSSYSTVYTDMQFLPCFDSGTDTLKRLSFDDHSVETLCSLKTDQLSFVNRGMDKIIYLDYEDNNHTFRSDIVTLFDIETGEEIRIKFPEGSLSYGSFSLVHDKNWEGLFTVFCDDSGEYRAISLDFDGNMKQLKLKDYIPYISGHDSRMSIQYESKNNITAMILSTDYGFTACRMNTDGTPIVYDSVICE